MPLNDRNDTSLGKTRKAFDITEPRILLAVPWKDYIWEYLIGEKKVGEKWLHFLQVTKFFPDFLFPDQYFSPIFFHLTRNLSRFFLSRIIIISHLFAKFIITIFFLMHFKHF